jgi:heme-degrading monooxygenase HmoA
VKVVLFRNHPKEGTYGDDYRALSQHLVETVSALPGFVSVEEFRGAGGEVLILAKFDSDEALSQWREHPEHRAAQGRREEFYAGYSVQVCTLDRNYGWQPRDRG